MEPYRAPAWLPGGHLQTLYAALFAPRASVHFDRARWDTPDGDFIGTPDLAYIPERIAIEYEGAQHRDDPRIYADDIERRERMQEAGWYVIRVVSDHVFFQPDWLATRIRRALVQRAA